MKAKINKNTVVLRIDRGEKIIEKLGEACLNLNIKAAQISGIGATNSFVCGVFNVETKEYKEIKYEGMYEILSITGNVTQKDGAPYIHAHICVANESGKAFGGHLIEANINVTCEIILSILDGEISRAFSEDIGINILEL